MEPPHTSDDTFDGAKVTDRRIVFRALRFAWKERAEQPPVIDSITPMAERGQTESHLLRRTFLQRGHKIGGVLYYYVAAVGKFVRDHGTPADRAYTHEEMLQLVDTSAFLRSEMATKLNAYAGGPKCVPSFLDAMMRRERAMHADWWVFYHGENCGMAFLSDVLRAFRDAFDLRPQPVTAAFYRGYYKQRDRHADIGQFLKTVNPRIVNSPGSMGHDLPSINDQNPELRPFLLSANLSLFISAPRRDEDSLQYLFSGGSGENDWIPTGPGKFTFARRAAEHALGWLKYDATGKRIERYDALFREYWGASTTNVMRQVFVHKNHANKIAYLSADYGRVIRITAENGIRLSLFQVLDMYRTDPVRLTRLIAAHDDPYVTSSDALQVRIFLKPSFFEDPARVQTYSYHCAFTPETQRKYERDISRLVREDLFAWLEDPRLVQSFDRDYWGPCRLPDVLAAAAPEMTDAVDASTTTQVYTDDVHAYDVRALWDISRAFPVQDVLTASLLPALLAQSWTDVDAGTDALISPTHVLGDMDAHMYHVRRIMRADLTHPILVRTPLVETSDIVDVVDGLHRLALAVHYRIPAIHVQYITTKQMQSAIVSSFKT